MDSEKYDISKAGRGELIYEQEDDNKCVARKCIFIRWIKPISVRELKFMSDNVLLIHDGKTLIFFDVNKNKENIVLAGTNSLVPSVGGDGTSVTLPLDGIACVDCCGTDLLALAEQPPISKVIVCRYPNFKVLATLIEDKSPYSASVKSMSFVKTEYLICLRDHPAHDLVVWAWRIGEKLIAVKTSFIQPDITLSVADGGNDGVLLSVVECDVKSRMELWQMFVENRLVHAKRTPVDLPSGVYVGSGTRCWAPGESDRGWFVFCDSSANVYRVRPEIAAASTAELCVEYTVDGGDRGGEGTPPVPAMLCPLAQGFVLHAAGRLTGFNEVNGVFEKIWTVIWDHMLQSVVVADDNNFYGWSDEGTLLKRTRETEVVLQYYGNNIMYFVFVKPTDLIVATINEKNMLQLWDVSTGEFKSEMKLNGEATNLCSNPLYYYVAISFKNGKVELLKTDPNEPDVKIIAKIVLSDEELSSTNFFRNGKELIVSYFPTGRFYHIEIELGRTCSVIRNYHMKKEVIDAKIFENQKSSCLTVLYRENQEIAKNAGDTLVIFNKQFDIIFSKSFDTQYSYTSIFKWISFDIPGILNIALTVLMSFSIRLVTISIAKGKELEKKTIPLDHDVRHNIKIFSWKNHCITFSEDGTYNIYEYNDDILWNKIVRVNCSHWQTGGLIAAEVDGSGRNVLTLSREGNFMCTSFKKTCNHARRSHQIGTPIPMKNIKTKGIGFEDGVGTSERMTWTMIKQNEELEIRNQKKKLFGEELEKINKRVLALYEENQNGPENERLDIKDFFNDDDEYGLWCIQKDKVEYSKEEEAKMILETNKNKIKTENIIKEYWDPLIVKPKSIHCIKSLYRVDNFSIGIKDKEIIDKSTQIIEKRTPLNLQFSKDEFKGSISHTLVDTIECLNSQFDYYKLDMANDEIILLEFMMTKLKTAFNKLFDDMFVEKQRTLDQLNGYNKRLRVIESEFRLACKIEPTAPSPVDYTFSQYEHTERLLFVEDSEVAVDVNDLILVEKQSTEKNEVLDEQSLKEQNFRKQALIKMMDGVLNKRWEDELKKDVPKPNCIVLNKKPKNYTASDLKAINKYEEAVVTLNNDRMKYKIILQDEKAKIDKNIQESIETLDEKIKNLFEIKIKYDSAIGQEYLKTLRISKMLRDINERKQQVKLLEETCLLTEKTDSELTEKIAKTRKIIIDLHSTLHTLKETDEKLVAEFNLKFHGTILKNVFNVRPKMEGNYSSFAGYQFVDTIMDPTDDKLSILSSSFVKYLNKLNANDDIKIIAKKKLTIKSITWDKLCDFRRLKIINEFKIINCKKEVTDTTHFLESLKQEVKNNKALMKKLKTSIIELENQDLSYRDDPVIQLIVKKGNTTEIKLTGHSKDFDNVVMVDKNVFSERTSELKEKELMRDRKLSDLLKLKRKCQNIKCDIDIQKQEIELYKRRCEIIKNMRVTKNVLYYQELKAKGIPMMKDAEEKLEKKRAAAEFHQFKQQKKLEREKKFLEEKIKKLKKKTRNHAVVTENHEIAKKISMLREEIKFLKTKFPSLPSESKS